MRFWIDQYSRTFVSLALVFILVGVSPRAEAFSPEQQFLYTKGKTALKAKEYNEALVHFRALLKDLRANTEELWQVLIALAVTHDEQGDIVPALEYYERFLRALTPVLPEAETKWRTRYELAVQTRHDLQAQLSKSHVRISIDSEPVGALIFINGEAAGMDGDARTPHVAYLEPGTHEFEIRYSSPSGVITAERKMELYINQPESWVATMRKEPVSLSEATRTSRIPPPSTPKLVDPSVSWTLFGVGATALTAGLFFTVEAASIQDELGALVIEKPENGAQQWTGLTQDLDQAEMTSWVLYSAGAALVGTAVTLLLWEGSSEGSPDSAEVGTSFQIMPSLTGATARMSF